MSLYSNEERGNTGLRKGSVDVKQEGEKKQKELKAKRRS